MPICFWRGHKGMGAYYKRGPATPMAHTQNCQGVRIKENRNWEKNNTTFFCYPIIIILTAFGLWDLCGKVVTQM